MDAVSRLIKNTLMILEEREWTRADLARAARPGVSKGYVYLMLDAAYDSSVKKWELLAKALGLTLGELYDWRPGTHKPIEGSRELLDFYNKADRNGRTAILASAQALAGVRSVQSDAD
jgi:hypothetical protein